MRITSILRRLAGHCVAYRSAVDQVFFEDLSTPNRLQSICRQIQIRATELQLDRHQILGLIPEMRLSSKAAPSVEPKRDVHREQELRARLKQRLEELPVWNQFGSENPLAAIVGLNTAKDYIQSLELHLPEIYEETVFLEKCANILLERRSRKIAVAMMIGLQHMGRNHISFLQPALDWLSDEEYWDFDSTQR
jgi:hypothetical protein